MLGVIALPELLFRTNEREFGYERGGGREEAHKNSCTQRAWVLIRKRVGGTDTVGKHLVQCRSNWVHKSLLLTDSSAPIIPSAAQKKKKKKIFPAPFMSTDPVVVKGAGKLHFHFSPFRLTG